MYTKQSALAVTLALGLAGTLHAQDSVSKRGTSLPGDSLDAFDTFEQQAAYVVDLSPVVSSWGNAYGAAPVAKTSKVGTAFTGSVMSANGSAALIKSGATYASSSYDFWQGPGFGVNTDLTISSAPGSISSATLDTPNQTYVGFAEFGTTDPGFSYSALVGAALHWEPKNPNRLYVTRTLLATNMPDDTGPKNASLAFGSIDEEGNAHMRADDFGAAVGTGISGNNYFRVNAANRAPNTINDISVTGPSDTGEWLLVNSATTHNTPSGVPPVFDGFPHLIGSNFASELVVECSIGSPVGTTAHLGVSSDHRGCPLWSKDTAFPGSAGTVAMLGKDDVGDTRGLLLVGVDACGDVTSTMRAVPPGFVFDTTTGKAVSTLGESIHYLSQTAFQGGNGQVAVRQVADGDLLAATVIGINAVSPSSPDGAIVVAKVDPSTSTVTGWTIAAYVDGIDGKPVLDGPGGTAVGRLTQLGNVTGGAPTGPSMSAPAMDSAGNIWFIAAMEHFNRPFDQYDTALIRAVYNLKDNSYQLEKVLELGQRFRGKNSKRPYIISFMRIADSNSVASDTVFSSATVQDGYNGRNTWGASSPRSLGGIVVSCEITYDVNLDGQYDTLGGTGVDEEYNVLLYLAPYKGRVQSDDTPPLQMGGTKSL